MKIFKLKSLFVGTVALAIAAIRLWRKPPVDDSTLQMCMRFARWGYYGVYHIAVALGPNIGVYFLKRLLWHGTKHWGDFWAPRNLPVQEAELEVIRALLNLEGPLDATNERLLWNQVGIYRRDKDHLEAAARCFEKALEFPCEESVDALLVDAYAARALSGVYEVLGRVPEALQLADRAYRSAGMARADTYMRRATRFDLARLKWWYTTAPSSEIDQLIEEGIDIEQTGEPTQYPYGLAGYDCRRRMIFNGDRNEAFIQAGHVFQFEKGARNQALNLLTQAEVWLLEANVASAERQALRALNLLRKEGSNSQFLCEALMMMGKVLFAKERGTEADLYLSEASQLAVRLKSKRLEGEIALLRAEQHFLLSSQPSHVTEVWLEAATELLIDAQLCFGVVGYVAANDRVENLRRKLT